MEYLQKSLAGLDISDDDIKIILLRSKVDPDAEVNFKDADTAVWREFSVVLGNASRNLSAGGASVSWNIEALKLFYTALCNRWGLNNVLLRPNAKVRDRSYMW